MYIIYGGLLNFKGRAFIIYKSKKMKGRERSMAIRSGINKQGWEKSDFPVACGKCYGENPYMRMLREDYGQECRLCFRPFTVFKWKGDKGIYKRTHVCQSCSKERNLCQVCTLDLEFNLPMEIRDKRCGKNGKLLLNQNFVTQNNEHFKPPPPPGPPPALRENSKQKEFVFIPQIPEQQNEQEDDKQKEGERVRVRILGKQEKQEKEEDLPQDEEQRQLIERQKEEIMVEVKQAKNQQ